MVRTHRRITITQYCNDIDVTISNLRRCSNVAPKLDSKFNSQCTMNVVLTTVVAATLKLRLQIHNGFTTLILRCQVDNVAPTLPFIYFI